MNGKQKNELIQLMVELTAFTMEHNNAELTKRTLSAQSMLISDVGRGTYSDAERQAIIDNAKKLRKAGMAWIDIADELGVKHGTIYNWVNGCKPRRVQ